MNKLTLANAAMLALFATHSQAGVIQLASPAALSATSLVRNYTDNPGDSYNDTVSYTLGTNSVNFSAASGVFTRFETGVDYLNSGFADNTQILFAGGNFGANAPVTLAFATPVLEVGFGLEEAAFGDYVITFTAFNGASELGTFTALGNDPEALSFVGARATGSDSITSLLISSDQGNNLVFGGIAFGTVIRHHRPRQSPSRVPWHCSRSAWPARSSPVGANSPNAVRNLIMGSRSTTRPATTVSIFEKD